MQSLKELTVAAEKSEQSLSMLTNDLFLLVTTVARQAVLAALLVLALGALVLLLPVVAMTPALDRVSLSMQSKMRSSGPHQSD